MQYSKHRQPLRVTSPKGTQRSTYWLQLPYKYSIPLLILSSLLSWLASQSLFLVQIEIIETKATISGRIQLSSCGFSPGAMILTMIVGTVIALGAVLIGFRRYPSEMPLASTCSAAISAACHPPPDDVDAAVLSVQWGVVSTGDELGHCSFSSRLVSPPIPGQIYI